MAKSNIKKRGRLKMRGKLIIALSLIALVLLLTVFLAIMEFSRSGIAISSTIYYRTVTPVIIAFAVGMLLLALLLFFILTYYVKPIRRILDSLESYNTYGKKYSVTFEGDDELAALNTGISDLAEENRQLRSRIAALKAKQSNSSSAAPDER